MANAVLLVDDAHRVEPAVGPPGRLRRQPQVVLPALAPLHVGVEELLELVEPTLAEEVHDLPHGSGRP